MSGGAQFVASEHLCAECLAWLCAADDAFCGRCGKPCAQLQIEALPAVLSLGQIPPRIGLRVTNPTCAALRLLSCLAPSWLDVKLTPGEEIAAGGSRAVFGRASIAPLRHAESAELRFVTTLGDAAVTLMVLPDEPELSSEPQALVYWSDGDPVTQDYDVSFFPATGHIRILRVLGTKDGWLSVTTAPAGPALVSRQAPLRLTVRFHPSRITAVRPGLLKPVTTAITVEYESAHGASQTRLNLRIEFRKAPELTWVGEHSPPRLLRQTAGQLLKLPLFNSTDADPLAGRQNAALAVRAVDYRPSSKSVSGSPQLLSPVPFELAGGESRDVEFQCNFEAVPPGIHYFEFFVETNRKSLDRVLRVPVEVREMSVFDGIVAIDFGTSNTCCALLSDDGDLASVPIDEENTTAPTLVRYIDLSGKQPLIEIGSRVKRLAAVDERVASSTVARLKQQLGESTHPLMVRPLNSEDWLTREAREAAADYLRQIRIIAERRQGSTFQEFILTHPAVCSLRQYRNLRAALENAFGREARVHFLQEPVASLIPFFAELSGNGARGQYTVAAFDLGGGTTDITVVRVEQHQLPGGVLEIRPEIVASWGERFGGEDLTDFLVNELKTRCRKVLQDKRPGYQLADKGVRGASIPSVRRNESALREWAEQFKASLSEDSKKETLSDFLLLNVVPEALDQLPDDQQFAAAELSLAGEDLTTVFLRGLRHVIDRQAQRLRRSAAHLPSLDFIQLSGKTAFLGEVSVVLREHFPKTTIQRAADPKECVVKGACLWRSLTRGRTRRLILPSSAQRTTSQIGVLDEDEVFRPLIGLDQPIPESGLLVELPNAWNGYDPFPVWENLGVENQRILEDGSRNPLISTLGTWEPTQIPPPQDSWWPLHLKLQRDFSLSVWSARNGQVIEFVPRARRRGNQ